MATLTLEDILFDVFMFSSLIITGFLFLIRINENQLPLKLFTVIKAHIKTIIEVLRMNSLVFLSFSLGIQI